MFVWLTLKLRVLLDMCRMALYKVAEQHSELRVSLADFTTPSTTLLMLAVGLERPSVASVHVCPCYVHRCMYPSGGVRACLSSGAQSASLAL